MANEEATATACRLVSQHLEVLYVNVTNGDREFLRPRWGRLLEILEEATSPAREPVLRHFCTNPDVSIVTLLLEYLQQCSQNEGSGRWADVQHYCLRIVITMARTAFLKKKLLELNCQPSILSNILAAMTSRSGETARLGCVALAILTKDQRFSEVWLRRVVHTTITSMAQAVLPPFGQSQLINCIDVLVHVLVSHTAGERALVLRCMSSREELEGLLLQSTAWWCLDDVATLRQALAKFRVLRRAVSYRAAVVRVRLVRARQMDPV